MADDVALEAVGAEPVLEKPTMRASNRTLRLVGWYLMLTALSLVILFPIWLTLVRALSPPIQYFNEGSPVTPVSPEWGVFGKAWDQGNIGDAMVRSLIMTIGITALQLITSVLAAYAFAFLHFPLKRIVFAVFMATLLLPLEVTLLANVTLIRQLHWIDSLQALILPFGATAFGTFLIRQAFLGIPHEIQDATRIDGYGHLDFLWRFAVPLTRPVVASFTVIAALGAWNQYLWPRAVIENPDVDTLQIALRNLTSTELASANIGVAGALLAAVPVVILLIIFQRQIIRGLTAGAVKG